ncbi:MAG: hypothetical protein JRC67_04255 [Deltaproteobacteria bacterium]|nr:hypothetical protein [Deltaproteobacteria bacterium]
MALSNVSARLAHEIRNPLTSAGGFARRLLQEMDPKDAQRSKVEIIVKEVGRLEHILKMILSYIRPVTLEFSDVDLNKLLQEVISGSEDKCGSQGKESGSICNWTRNFLLFVPTAAICATLWKPYSRTLAAICPSNPAFGSARHTMVQQLFSSVILRFMWRTTTRSTSSIPSLAINSGRLTCSCR